MRKLSWVVAVALIVATPLGAMAQYVEAAQFIYYAWQEGVKWQNQQPWGKFKSWVPSRPVAVGNLTDETVTFTSESATCSKQTFSLAPGENASLGCDSGSGDNWYNIEFRAFSFGIDAGRALAFDYSKETGEIEPFDMTDDVTDFAEKQSRLARGGVSSSMVPCQNSGPFKGAPAPGSSVDCQ